VGSQQPWNGTRFPFLFPYDMRMSGESGTPLIRGGVSAKNERHKEFRSFFALDRNPRKKQKNAI